MASPQETHWAGLICPLRERELDLQHFRRHILFYWSGTPTQHRQTNRLHRQMHTSAASRELSLSQGELLLTPGHTLVSRDLCLRNFSITIPPPGHTSGTRRAIASGGWPMSFTARPRTSRREPSRTLPRVALTPSGSWTTPAQSRLSSSPPATQPPGTPAPDRGAFNVMGKGASPVGCCETLIRPAAFPPFPLPPTVSFGYLFLVTLQ